MGFVCMRHLSGGILTLNLLQDVQPCHVEGESTQMSAKPPAASSKSWLWQTSPPKKMTLRIMDEVQNYHQFHEQQWLRYSWHKLQLWEACSCWVTSTCAIWERHSPLTSTINHWLFANTCVWSLSWKSIKRSSRFVAGILRHLIAAVIRDWQWHLKTGHVSQSWQTFKTFPFDGVATFLTCGRSSLHTSCCWDAHFDNYFQRQSKAMYDGYTANARALFLLEHHLCSICFLH